MKCECCLENDVWDVAVENGYNHCETCSTDSTCDTCGRISDPHYLWEAHECEACQRAGERAEWLAETMRAVEDLAADRGWECGRWHDASTGSRYIELIREAGDAVQTVRVRVSDHGSAYCSEDISIAMNPSGDDHTLEILAKRLSR